MFFVMRDLLYLERVEEAETLLKPQRIEVLRQLAEPRSCTEVAARLDQTQQRVYYHVKRLVEHGLVTQVAERRVRGINEGVYQASARAYWLSPGLVGRIGQRQQRDEASHEDEESGTARVMGHLHASGQPGNQECCPGTRRRS